MNQKNIQIDSHVTLIDSIKVWTVSDNDHLTLLARPDAITDRFKSTPVVWTDKAQNTIGFADAENCLVFTISDIVSISIHNTIPAKGAGGSYLHINLKSKNYVLSALYGPYAALNSYKNKISKMVGITVQIDSEYHDC